MLHIEAEAKASTSLFKSDSEDFRGWILLSEECESVVEGLEEVLKKYKHLGTNHRRNWDRIQMGNENVNDLRNRLIAKTTALPAYFTQYLG